MRKNRELPARRGAAGRIGARVTVFLVELLFLGGGLAAPTASAQTSGKRPVAAPVHKSVVKRIKPSVRLDVVKVKVGKKTSTYHRTAQARPAEFSVQGPARVQVLARNLFAATGAAPVKLRIELDGKPAKTMRLKATKSKKATLAAGGAIEGLARVTLEIPAGKHKLRVVPEEAAGMAALRVLRGNPVGKGKVKWVTYAPQEFERSLILRSGDKEETWYRFTAEKPATMQVRGPLRLKISSRLDFDQHAGPSQAYVVRAFIDAKSEGYSLKSRVSQVGTYPDMPEIVPGMSQAFTIKVPAGLHKIVLRLDGTTATGATVKVQVPERDLKAANKS